MLARVLRKVLVVLSLVLKEEDKCTFPSTLPSTFPSTLRNTFPSTPTSGWHFPKHLPEHFLGCLGFGTSVAGKANRNLVPYFRTVASFSSSTVVYRACTWTELPNKSSDQIGRKYPENAKEEQTVCSKWCFSEWCIRKGGQDLQGQKAPKCSKRLVFSSILRPF